MRSKAAIAGHPIHPMLVPIPIGAYFVALLGDALHMAVPSDRFWYDLSYTCIGIGIFFSVLAAVAGSVDYLGVNMSANAFRTATKHLLLNVSMVILYVVSFLVRRSEAGAEGRRWLLALGSGLLAFGLLGISGWLGGKLAYHYHVGMDEGGTGIGTPEAPARRASAAS